MSKTRILFFRDKVILTLLLILTILLVAYKESLKPVKMYCPVCYHEIDTVHSEGFCLGCGVTLDSIIYRNVWERPVEIK